MIYRGNSIIRYNAGSKAKSCIDRR